MTRVILAKVLRAVVACLLLAQMTYPSHAADQIVPPSALKCKDYVELNEKAMVGPETWNTKAVTGLYYLAFAMGVIQATIPGVFDKPAQSSLEISNEDFFRWQTGLMNSTFMLQCKKQPDVTFDAVIRNVGETMRKASQ